MKNLNTNSITDLAKLKESLASVIDQRISALKLNENISVIDTANLPVLVSIFENLSDKLYESKDGKKILKKYIKCIKEAKELKNVYRIYKSIKCPTDVLNANMYLNESVKLCQNIDRNLYLIELEKLKNIVKNGIKESKINTETLDETLKCNDSINESFDYVFDHKPCSNNIKEYTNCLHKLCESIKSNNKTSEKQYENVSFNSFYQKLTEDMEGWNKKLFDDIVLANLSNKSENALFEEYKNSCLTILESDLSNLTDTEAVSRLKDLKKKVENKTYNKDTFSEDISNLAELKKTLE